MKISFALLPFFLFLCLSANAQLIELTSEQTDKGYQIFAKNLKHCPVSVKFDFDMKNLRSTEDANQTFVIPAKAEKHLVTELLVKDLYKPSEFDVKTKSNYGNHNLQSYDADFQYHLPFKTNETYVISQGYNGRFSHHGENALDFELPNGTEIYAARGGVVVDIVQNFSRSCTQPQCEEYNNFITVYHDDGTFADYTHIKRNGAIVQEGDKVEIGQLLGYSGKVGFASGPHLHFMVYLQKLRDRESLQTKFLVGDGSKAVILEETKTYSKNY